ncbi:molybdate ABC transporter permease subunit [Labilibaculum sp. A4]|uniref:Molybdenum transport system permease n=2 Tax=Labilibaculum TaxID=2060722 RepID=A0A425Y8S9_9BACT|nr:MULTISPECIES: molybdate ABC transporter permease subunit [Labilibaculum]MDQ1770165.1 molybdate ABC transporter permease subunit [Labilibaculum euxinus]MUP38968.1 molybdate ABC transporter permease subunit [Labilibaculum euxinus]MVB08173.1 molybdate ABC transporter permease subunit [Labilibaculum euxinus]MWN77621.1 molybdate ABC transporter permease subunit [Labilibaculum euxinus]PKQ68388.1 molybdate ABC transporter permease [Labilibaculum manganireducens]
MEHWFVFSETEMSAIGLSFKVALWCAVLVLPIAVLMGWWLARKTFRGKSLIEGFINLPLVLPPVATGFILLLLLGTKGLIGHWLNELLGIRIAFTYYAAVIASMIVSFPLAVRAIRLSIEMVDPGFEEAAKTLGASTFQSFVRVTLPLALPGIISGFVLSFARSLGEFGATIIFAGNISGETQTIPLALFNQIQMPGMESSAFRLLLVAVLFSFLAMAFSEYLVKKLHKRN